MSTQVYGETQTFLEDKWGPLGGWAQAVMFAADLKVSNTPKSTSVKSMPQVEKGTSPNAQTEEMASPRASQGKLDPSPRKRKTENVEFRRTRSATRLSMKRSDSELLMEQVNHLEVKEGREMIQPECAARRVHGTLVCDGTHLA